MRRMRKKEHYSGEYYEYIKDEINDWDVNTDYYEDDVIIYKNKPYKANKDTNNANYTQFVTDDWDRITKDEAYYDDVPVYFWYSKRRDNNNRINAIQGLKKSELTKVIFTTSDIEFKTNDKILLQFDEHKLKIDNVDYDEDTDNNSAYFQWNSQDTYRDKIITLK